MIIVIACYFGFVDWSSMYVDINEDVDCGIHESQDGFMYATINIFNDNIYIHR